MSSTARARGLLPRAGRFRPRRSRVLVAVLCVAVASAAFVTTAAVAHWYGFTQEAYFCYGTFNNKPYGGVTGCRYNSQHSWGFVSLKHEDTTGALTAEFGAKAWGSESVVFWGYCNCGTSRACYNGIYPNCHDQDSVMLAPYFTTDWGDSFAHGGHMHGWY